MRLLGGDSGGAATAVGLASLWIYMAGLLFFRGAGRLQIYTWTSRMQAGPPNMIVLPVLPPDDEEPPNSL